MPEIEMPSPDEVRAATVRFSSADAFKKVVKIRDNLTVKYGNAVKLLEAGTMRFVADNSAVHVPKIHGSFTDPETDEHFIVMDFIPGETLEKLLPTLNQQEKDQITQRIKEAVAELRRIPSPGYIGGIKKSAIPHDMFWFPGRDPIIAGPFENEAAFNEGLLRRLGTVSSMTESYLDTLRELFNEALKNHRIVFTHSDLQPKNIMVHRTSDDEDGIDQFQITIIDWEDAGWYPDYWEFCQANVMAQYRAHWLAMSRRALSLPGYEYTLMQMVFHILYY
ncbi:phosphotransferase enzyme family protein [Dissoconium aciculare CBS 342.82]|uniref:Phosphotransferase enzyme family protein n=1 Tax=Dissoconium aciculare CBS 342.82 TaxID=1314786 RepID=A0A6J3LR84_9PEZI|nr:phosphotransferase enzyme family protein [Dissoconium aciculare CBS 342.82]KAF1817784.1 phosphotransferase enzyme family protein [Dissoconium aciculare CBS 342.82]